MRMGENLCKVQKKGEVGVYLYPPLPTLLRSFAGK